MTESEQEYQSGVLDGIDLSIKLLQDRKAELIKNAKEIEANEDEDQ